MRNCGSGPSPDEGPPLFVHVDQGSAFFPGCSSEGRPPDLSPCPPGDQPAIQQQRSTPSHDPVSVPVPVCDLILTPAALLLSAFCATFVMVDVFTRCFQSHRQPFDGPKMFQLPNPPPRL